MSGWAFDDKRFVEEALTPVRDGWPPERDWFRVYLLPVEVSDEKVISTALAEVKRQLGLPRYRTFAKACELLKARHPEAVAVLTDPGRRRAHRAQVQTDLEKLAGSLEARLNGAPAMPTAEVTVLAKKFAPDYAKRAIQDALKKLGAVRDPVPLPPTPVPRQWDNVAGLLTKLRYASVWAYLDKTDELSGPATTPDQITRRRDELRKSRSAESTAEIEVLKHVETWLGDGGLAGALRFEIVEALSRQVEFDFQATARAAKELAGRLGAVGLPRNHADLAYAVWCARRYGQREPESAWLAAYQEALRSGRLRSALEVLAGQPDLTKEWQFKRDELRGRLAELDEKLRRCRALEATDQEAAVEAYLRIRAELTDQAIDVAIERCRPAPPRRATARVDGATVIVEWEPSPATAGRIGYRVARGGTVVAEAGASPIVDERPPGGAPVTYSVSTLRDGHPSAGAAVTNAVTVLAEVQELELQGGPDSISGRWRLPDRAGSALVTRSHGGGVHTTLPGTHTSTFVDRDVRPGESYEYRVRARYRLPGGSTATSDGLVASAGCREVPAPVTDLRVEFDGDELVADWTPPPRGEVELLLLEPGDERPNRELLPVDRAHRYGIPLRVTGLSSRGHLRSRVPGAGRLLVLLPVTVLGDLAAVGKACEVNRMHGSIRALRALRLGATVRLSWEWPAGALQARVLWRHGVRPEGPTDPRATVLDITKVTYESSGVQVTVASGECWFAVCTFVPSANGPTFGPMVLARAATPGKACYRVQRGSRYLRRPWVLRVEAADGAELPAVVLVAKAGLRPMRASDGEQVLRLEAGPSPRRGEFMPPAGLRRPVHLRAFPETDQLVLIPTRPDELIVT